MGAGTQRQGMTGPQTHGHGSQGREHQEHRR
jgi:hypothetical protein